MRQFTQKLTNNPWFKGVFYSILLVIIFLFFGWLLSNDCLNKHAYLSGFAILREDGTAFSYIEVLFAIQIPLFILLLEKVYDAGYIRRFSMINILNYREILAVYVTLSLCLIFSPRASYYYFPTVGLTVASVYAIYISIRGLFETYTLREKEQKYIKRLIKEDIKAILKDREKLNEFYKKIEGNPHIEYSFFDTEDDNTSNKHSIYPSETGVVKSINIDKLSKLMTDQNQKNIIKQNDNDILANPSEQRPHLILKIRPGDKIEEQAEIAKLFLPNLLEPSAPSKRIDKDIASVAKCIKIAPDQLNSTHKKTEELFRSMNQQLRHSIKEDSEDSIYSALNIYNILIDIIKESIPRNSGDSFKIIRNNFNWPYDSGISSHTQKITEIMDDTFLYVLRTESWSITKALSLNMETNLWSEFNNFSIFTTILAENSFNNALLILVYYDDTILPNASYKDVVAESLTLKLKQHTRSLIYKYKDAAINNKDQSPSKDQLFEWFDFRISNTAKLLVGAFKKSKLVMFNNILSIFSYRRTCNAYSDTLILQAQCMLFMVASYIYSKSDLTEDQKKIRGVVSRYVSVLSGEELTEILIECIDNNYIDKWNWSTLDLSVDDGIRSTPIPDFSKSIKSLWVEQMLLLDYIPKNISVRPYKNNIEKTTAFLDLIGAENSYIIQYLQKKNQKDEKVAELTNLVNKFIEKRKEYETEKLINTKLNKDIVTKFSEELLDNYNKSALAFSVFEKVGCLKREKTTKDIRGMLSYGWNQTQDKSWFIEDRNLIISQAQDYGEEIAEAENRYIIESMISDKQLISTDNFSNWIKKLRQNKESWFIISVGVSNWYITYGEKNNFSKHIDKNSVNDGIWFEKIEQIAPIYYIRDDKLQKGLYAITANHDLGELLIKTHVDKLVKISIDAYSHNDRLLEDTLSSPPDWLKDKGDKQKQASFLKTQVRVLIQHLFKYTPAKTPTIYYYPVTDEDSD